MTEFIPAELDRYCYWQTERESIRYKKEAQLLPSPWMIVQHVGLERI